LVTELHFFNSKQIKGKEKKGERLDGYQNAYYIYPVKSKTNAVFSSIAFQGNS